MWLVVKIPRIDKTLLMISQQTSNYNGRKDNKIIGNDLFLLGRTAFRKLQNIFESGFRKIEVGRLTR